MERGLTLSLAGMARCAVRVAERSVRRRNGWPEHAQLATRSALRFAPGGDIAARCPYPFKDGAKMRPREIFCRKFSCQRRRTNGIF
jgi:hypothetical protein